MPVVARVSAASAILVLLIASGCGASAAVHDNLQAPAPNASLTPPPQAAGYQPVFDEEFTAFSLSNTGKGAGYTWYNPGIWWQAPAPAANIAVSDGVLGLTWTKGQTPAYDTSIATTADDASSYTAWTYGYIEVRMKFNPTSGNWPALWLMPTAAITDPTAEHGELDIFEWQSLSPNVFYGTIHDWVGGADAKNNSGSNAFPLPPGTDLSAFHTYGVLWTPSTTSWYFDNSLLGSSPTYAVFGTQSYFLILGQQIGADWKSSTSGVSATALTMNVQWVHVFQQQ
jgi:beta-glucanase (GH16 family)